MKGWDGGPFTLSLHALHSFYRIQMFASAKVGICYAIVCYIKSKLPCKLALDVTSQTLRIQFSVWGIVPWLGMSGK